MARAASSCAKLKRLIATKSSWLWLTKELPRRGFANNAGVSGVESGDGSDILPGSCKPRDFGEALVCNHIMKVGSEMPGQLSGSPGSSEPASGSLDRRRLRELGAILLLAAVY